MIYAFADIEIDAAKQEVRRNKNPLRLPPRAVALLHLLAANSERLVSKAEIVDERGRVFHHEDILEHREQPTSRLKTLRLAPPERRITRDQFENLEEQIERQAAIKPEGMSLEEIRSFRP